MKIICYLIYLFSFGLHVTFAEVKEMRTVNLKEIEFSFFAGKDKTVYFVMHNMTSSGFFVPINNSRFYGNEFTSVEVDKEPVGSQPEIFRYSNKIKKELGKVSKESDHRLEKSNSFFSTVTIALIIPGTDSDSFAALNENYAIDKHNAYYRNQKINGADVDVFKTISNDYAVSRLHVYYKNVIIKGANPRRFKVFNDGYCADEKSVFYINKIVESANPAKFSLLKYGYYKDDKSVFYNGKRVSGANPDDFTSFKESGFFHCNGNIYLSGNKVEGALYSSFKILSGLYQKDEDNVYVHGRKIEVMDVATFEVAKLKNGKVLDHYGIDKKNVYYFGEIIEIADAASFKIFIPSRKTSNNKYYDAQDINHKYQYGQKVE